MFIITDIDDFVEKIRKVVLSNENIVSFDVIFYLWKFLLKSFNFFK